MSREQDRNILRNEAYLTTNEVAAILGTKSDVIRKMIKFNKVKAAKMESNNWTGFRYGICPDDVVGLDVSEFRQTKGTKGTKVDIVKDALESAIESLKTKPDKTYEEYQMLLDYIKELDKRRN